MNAARKRKLLWILFFLVILSLVTGLVSYALRQNISLFYAPSDLSKTPPPLYGRIRLGGMVEKGSLHRSTKDLSVEFKITDYKKSITVAYRGILPDLFREGQGIVALGELMDKDHFKADEVLAKHDANYMPPEVKKALKDASKDAP